MAKWKVLVTTSLGTKLVVLSNPTDTVATLKSEFNQSIIFPFSATKLCVDVLYAYGFAFFACSHKIKWRMTCQELELLENS